MDRKLCECYAIRLIDDMTKAYDYWLSNPERGEKRLVNSAQTIYFHLNDEFKEGEFTEKQEPYFGLLDKMRSALSKGDFTAMEIVRNLIHKNDELKQLITCGTPYVDKNSLSETARVLTEALNAMEITTPADARIILDKQYEKLSCGKK